MLSHGLSHAHGEVQVNVDAEIASASTAAAFNSMDVRRRRSRNSINSSIGISQEAFRIKKWRKMARSITTIETWRCHPLPKRGTGADEVVWAVHSIGNAASHETLQSRFKHKGDEAFVGHDHVEQRSEK
jgi:hypothetical protein